MMMVALDRDLMCMKHGLEDQVTTARREYLVLEASSKELPHHLAPVLMYLKVTLLDVSKVFCATECTCWEGPATELIGGASWVSNGDDVANLPDVLEY